MEVIRSRNVNDALSKGIHLMLEYGDKVSSRVGDTLEIPEPVATVYSRPWERVLISDVRDANPFFHMMEAMWILAGREDVKFLTEFNKRMADFSDDGEVFNAPYGYRLRNGNCNAKLDQLSEVIKLLKRDPNSRQAVCQIWDEDDLVNHNTKDKACNMSVVFRVRNGKLTMTVYNRSNDMLWGAYGANVVQFSMIQEYVAAHLDLPMGEYTQVSNAFHVYTSGPGGELWDRLVEDYVPCDIVGIFGEDAHFGMSCSGMKSFDSDLKQLFQVYDNFGLAEVCELPLNMWKSRYFRNLVMPMLVIWYLHKTQGPDIAFKYADKIESRDWRIACEQWLTKRIK